MKPNLERRHAERRTTRVEAVLLRDGGRRHVMILDYHKTGMQLWVREKLTPGMDAHLVVAGHDVRTRVLWCEGKHAGVNLLDPLNAEVARILSNAKEAAS